MITLEDISVGETIPDFRLLLELGRGAFARVFLAQQLSMQRMVALKITERASIESPLLSNLDHPNIVRVYDERCVDGLSLLYMQYIPGKSLRQVIHAAHLDQDVPWTGSKYVEHVAATLIAIGETPIHAESVRALNGLSWSETVAWLGARIAHALEHAHAKRIWHRDIKPENILIAADGRPMLADFNLSFGGGIVAGHRLEEFGGSYPYMSPEHIDVLLARAAPESVTAPSDLFSMAVVLMELLTGARPFPSVESGPDALRLLRDSRSKIPAIHDRKQYPEGLVQAILGCFAPHPQDRPSAKQMARSLLVCTESKVHRLLYPDAKSYAARWQAHPMTWLIALGLIPNALVAGLNIWANHRLTIHNFDQTFFRETELLPVNLVAFAAGLAISVWILWPIAAGFRATRRGPPLPPAKRHAVASRCLFAPFLSAGNILLLFSISGLVFPLWNQCSSQSRVTSTDILGFFLSQVLHGLVAAGSTLVITALVTVRAFYPKFLCPDESEAEQHELDRFQWWLLAATNVMGVIPLFALLSLVMADQFDKSVFLALATAGFASHLLSSFLTPVILACVRSLRFALSPTVTLLQRGE